MSNIGNTPQNPQDIIAHYSAKEGIFDTIFGKILDRLVFDQKIEEEKHILSKVFGLKDITSLIPTKFKANEFHKLNETINRYSNDLEAKKR